MLENISKEWLAQGNMIMWALFGLIGFGVLAVCILMVIIKMQYKHQIVIRKIINGKSIIIHDKAKDFTDSNKVNWWKRMGEKKELALMPIPPAQAIDITMKGKLYAEAYQTENGDYRWIEDKRSVAEIPANIFGELPKDIADETDLNKRDKKEKEWKKLKKKEWLEKYGIVEAFHPLTSQQRALLVNNIRKAEEKRQNSWTQNISLIVGVSAAVILVIALLVFYGDIAKPVIEASKERTAQMELQKEQLQILKDIKQNIQTIPATNEQNKAPN